MDQRVKALIDQHLASDMESDDETGGDVYMSEVDDDNADDDDDGVDDLETDKALDEPDEPSIVLDFEQGRYDRAKLLKINQLVYEEYESNLQSDQESPHIHYVDL